MRGFFDFMSPHRGPARQREMPLGDGRVIRLFTEMRDADDVVAWSVGPAEEPHWSETWFLAELMEPFAEILQEEAATRHRRIERAAIQSESIP